MKAVQINEFGGPEVMKYQDVADPVPGEGEAVVEIQAAGVNFTDVSRRQGVNPGPPLPRAQGGGARRARRGPAQRVRARIPPEGGTGDPPKPIHQVDSDRSPVEILPSPD